MKKCVLVYNPNSGNGKVKKYLSDIIPIIRDKGYDVDVFCSKYKGHTIEIVRDINKADLVMSFGGDGTFNEAMRGNMLRKNRLVLAHIPVGTTNDVGAMFGYGKNILRNVLMTLEGEVKDVDICMINNIPFIYVAGFGKYMDISYDTPRDLKKKLGYFAYIKEGVKAFFSKVKMYDIGYNIDGKEYRGLFSLILISSANHIAGFSNVYNDVKLNDNKFEVVFCNIKSKREIFKSLYFLTKYDASRVPGFYFYRTNDLKIKFYNKGRECWGIDGERLNDHGEEFEIKIINNVKIMVPLKNIKKLFIN